MSQGGVIDETALAQALVAGEVAGAALDVFTQEPLPADSPFGSEASPSDPVDCRSPIGFLSRFEVTNLT
nr:NAD(P)-dependent oxidoreductase [Rhizobium leguminosarum]